MRRREFISLVGGAAAWPLTTRAQQGERMRRIGVLMGPAADDPQSKPRVAAFLQGLHKLGWTEGRNVQIDIRWGVADAAISRRYAAEMVALAPDVILTAASAATAAMQEATRTLPIVFVNVADPVAAGYVASLARPAVTSPGLPLSNTARAGNGLSFLRKLRRT